MPLEHKTIEIVLEGLDQKADKKTQAPGKLRFAYNCEFDKGGALNKRRGYTRIDTESELDGNTVEQVWQDVTTFQDELLLVGTEFLYSVTDISGNTGSGSSGSGEDIVQRGPILRGNYRIQYVAGSAIGEQ